MSQPSSRWPKRIRQQRAEGTQALFEHPPKGESSCNQTVEGAIGITQGLVRTMQSSLEARLRCSIGPKHRIVPWLVEHAVNMRNRFQPGPDQKTPQQRLRGRPADKPVHEVGELILFRPLTQDRSGDWDDKFAKGIYPGARMDGLSIVTHKGGAIMCRTTRSLPEEEKWRLEAVHAITAMPWVTKG